MPITKRRGLFDSARIVYVSLSDITVPPSRCRNKRSRDDDELVRSVLRYGVLQPISVRRRESRYELISGSRRYFAARYAGLSEIPCIILNVDTPEGELIALTENLQRRDLDFVEEAEELHRLIHLHNFSQDEASRRIGKSQSAIANKLRLLRLPRDVLYFARDAGITERHLRALLPLNNLEQIKDALNHIITNDLTVAETEKYVDRIINPHPEPKIGICNTTMFMNTVDRAVDMMRRSGFSVDTSSEDADNKICVYIVISKKPSL